MNIEEIKKALEKTNEEIMDLLFERHDLMEKVEQIDDTIAVLISRRKNYENECRKANYAGFPEREEK